MYRAFKLEHIDWTDRLIARGKELFEESSKVARQDLDAFISGGSINGSLLRDHWFENSSADVFISHSHKDRDSAFGLAGFLKEAFSLDCFIDSGVWGHSSQLLKRLDNRYCYDPKREAYDYDARNVTTSHVHMMLATALSRVMDTAECAIFVSTPNSVSHSDGGGALVSSPWIFYELSQIAILRREHPMRRILKESEERNFSIKAAAVQIDYEADFRGLDTLEHSILVEWVNRWDHGESIYDSPLAMLYDIKDGTIVGS